MIHIVMLDWLVQAYGQGPSFGAPIPFASASSAIEAGNAVLRHRQHDKVRIFHAIYDEIRLDIRMPLEGIREAAVKLEIQAQVAAEIATVQSSHKPGGPRH